MPALFQMARNQGPLMSSSMASDRLVQSTSMTDEAAKRFGAWTERLAVTLIMAAALSACGNAPHGPVAVGPVDHECHGNPARSQGSGCEDNP